MMEKYPISAIILTRNEEKNLASCIESIEFCSEIIVVDDESTDKTLEIAKKNGAKIITRKLSNDFSSQRNMGLHSAANLWVLFIDGDEVLSSLAKQSIIEIVTNQITRINGYAIKRTDILWGKKLLHGETGNMWLVRFGKKTSGKWVGKVHEHWEIKGEIGRVSGELLHRPHENISSFLKKINKYSTIRAEELFEKKITTNWYLIILYTKGKFIKNYIVYLGFLDGIAGFLHAALMSFHSFMTRGKLWLLWHKR